MVLRETSRPKRGLLPQVTPLLALLILGALAWQLASVLLQLFGAAVIAILLRALSDPITRRTPLPAPASLALVVLSVFALVGGIGTAFGFQITAETNEILDRLPAAWGWLQSSPPPQPAATSFRTSTSPRSSRA